MMPHNSEEIRQQAFGHAQMNAALTELRGLGLSTLDIVVLLAQAQIEVAQLEEIAYAHK